MIPIRPAEPSVVDFTSVDQQQDLIDEGYTEELAIWYEIPFEKGDIFPQDRTFVLQVPDNNRTYRIRYNYNYSYGTYFLTVSMWDVTNANNEVYVFARKVIENVVYRVGYGEILFTTINITKKWLVSGEDPDANIVGVIRPL